MWTVQYIEGLNTVAHPEEFKTRKAARHWCRRARKFQMTLLGPNGEVEPFTAGV